MLTRLHIDNLRCFVDFEYRPGREELVLGRNGSGKSSLLDVFLFLRQFVITGRLFDELGLLGQRTRWLGKDDITFELEAELDGAAYLYRLVLEPWGDPVRSRAASETLHLEGKPLFEFVNGEVQPYDDSFERKVAYEFDPHRSALNTIMPRSDNQRLTRFKQWLDRSYCFRLNPYSMGARAEGENNYPNVNLSNIAAWYRYLVQVEPKRQSALAADLRESVDGFDTLRFLPAGENVSVLAAEFALEGDQRTTLNFGELSDGQRCLIALYMILRFVVMQGGTVVIDEPENFIALREIQPWLMALSDTVEQSRGQVLLISHHPEIINQWAPSHGVQFVRDATGMVRVEKFRGDPESGLPAAELIARGWDVP